MARLKPTTAAAVASDDETSSDSEEEEQQQQPPPKASAAAAAEKSSKTKSKHPPSSDDEDNEGEEQNQYHISYKPDREPHESSDDDGDEETDNESVEENEKKKRSPPQSPPKVEKKSVSQLQPPKEKKSQPTVKSLPTLSRKKLHSEASDLENGGDAKKRKLFERIWSDDAEEKILSGIIDFHSRRGTKPSTSNSDIDALHEFMKKNLNGAEFTKAQLSNKFRTLRKKFRTNSAKNGGSPNFARPVDRTVYDLSKKIWGPKENGNDEGDGAAIESDKGSDEETDAPLKTPHTQTPQTYSTSDVIVSKEVELDFPNFFEALTSSGTLKLNGENAKRILAKVDNGKAVALEEKLRKHKKVEMKTHLRWLELMKEVTKLTLEAVDKSD